MRKPPPNNKQRGEADNRNHNLSKIKRSEQDSQEDLVCFNYSGVPPYCIFETTKQMFSSLPKINVKLLTVNIETTDKLAPNKPLFVNNSHLYSNYKLVFWHFCSLWDFEDNPIYFVRFD